MIDGGAYIGDVSCVFALQYPSLKIIAVEPNADNWPLLRANVSQFAGQVAIEQAALWQRPGQLTLSGAQMGATVVGGAGGGQQVCAVTIPDLMLRYAMPAIDILKLDIEGAEFDLLLERPAWLNLVRMLIVEVHSAARGIELRVALEQSGFTIVEYRSLWYCYGAGE